jgi:hypothetical protein
MRGWCMWTNTIPLYLYSYPAIQLLRFTNGVVDIWQ